MKERLKLAKKLETCEKIDKKGLTSAKMSQTNRKMSQTSKKKSNRVKRKWQTSEKKTQTSVKKSQEDKTCYKKWQKLKKSHETCKKE